MLRSISLPGEHWKQAKGFSYNYFASNMGRIATITYFGGKEVGIMKPAKSDKWGHQKTVMDGRSVAVHRVIAETWLKNPLKLPCVNHINSDPSDNRVENLEFCSKKYNAYHGYHAGNIKKPVSKNIRKALTKEEQKEIREYYLQNMIGITSNHEKKKHYEKLYKKYPTAGKQQIQRYATGQLKLNYQPLTIPSVCAKHHTHIVSDENIII